VEKRKAEGGGERFKKVKNFVNKKWFVRKDCCPKGPCIKEEASPNGSLEKKKERKTGKGKQKGTGEFVVSLA